MKVIRVRAIDVPDSPCEGCLGCSASDQECLVLDDSMRRISNWIFIRDTEQARAEYAALVLEHGLLPDKSF